jgi:Phage integrase, N-terminal SAM-like domain
MQAGATAAALVPGRAPSAATAVPSPHAFTTSSSANALTTVAMAALELLQVDVPVADHRQLAGGHPGDVPGGLARADVDAAGEHGHAVPAQGAGDLRVRPAGPGRSGGASPASRRCGPRSTAATAPASAELLARTRAELPVLAGLGEREELLAAAWLASLRAPRTRRAYAADMRGWLAERGADVLDAGRVHVDLWAAGKQDRGAESSTVRRRLSALSSFRRLKRCK